LQAVWIDALGNIRSLLSTLEVHGLRLSTLLIASLLSTRDKAQTLSELSLQTALAFQHHKLPIRVTSNESNTNLLKHIRTSGAAYIRPAIAHFTTTTPTKSSQMAEPRMRLRQKGQQFSNPERVSLSPIESPNHH
jgi:hypothetical protein